MNKGTKIRVILRIAASLQTAISATTVAVQALAQEYGCIVLLIVWLAFAILCDFVVSAITTYYNQDFSIEGDTGTKITRQMKEDREKFGGESGAETESEHEALEV